MEVLICFKLCAVITNAKLEIRRLVNQILFDVGELSIELRFDLVNICPVATCSDLNSESINTRFFAMHCFITVDKSIHTRIPDNFDVTSLGKNC